MAKMRRREREQSDQQSVIIDGTADNEVPVAQSAVKQDKRDRPTIQVYMDLITSLGGAPN